MRNYVEIVRPFFDEIRAKGLEVQGLGGLGSAALLHADVHFDLAEPGIYLPADFFLGKFRDSNSSLRDVDVMDLSTDPANVAATEAIGKEIIGDLKVNVFGLHPIEELDHMKQNPFCFEALTASLSDRYVQPKDGPADNGTFIKAVFPFGVEVPNEALETWQLHIGEHTTLPVSQPAVMLLNNMTRSIGGPRKKYRESTIEAVAMLKEKAPELIDWMVDGPGQSQLMLAGVLRTVGSRHPWSSRVIFGKNLFEQPPKLRDIREHPAFLLNNAPSSTQRQVLALAKLRGMLVGIGEEHFRDFWEEKDCERFVKGIVRNRRKPSKALPGTS